MGSIIHTNVTNTGSVTLPYNEVWFFLDGGERLQSMESILGGPGVSTNWYSGETTYYSGNLIRLQILRTWQFQLVVLTLQEI